MNDRKAIESMITRFIAAYNAGDLTGILDCYSSDLIKLRHGAPAETKEQLAVRLGEVFREYETHLEVDNQEIVAGGGLGWARGVLSVTLTPRRGGEPLRVRRRFLELWRRESGGWRVARTMDNVE